VWSKSLFVWIYGLLLTCTVEVECWLVPHVPVIDEQPVPTGSEFKLDPQRSGCALLGPVPPAPGLGQAPILGTLVHG
jgi:hypothetical protein